MSRNFSPPVSASSDYNAFAVLRMGSCGGLWETTNVRSDQVALIGYVARITPRISGFRYTRHDACGL